MDLYDTGIQVEDAINSGNNGGKTSEVNVLMFEGSLLHQEWIYPKNLKLCQSKELWSHWILVGVFQISLLQLTLPTNIVSTIKAKVTIHINVLLFVMTLRTLLNQRRLQSHILERILSQNAMLCLLPTWGWFIKKFSLCYFISEESFNLVLFQFSESFNSCTLSIHQ